jgi:putative toxin-antitoxin system antitoxin component (TIGR02293 family)
MIASSSGRRAASIPPFAAVEKVLGKKMGLQSSLDVHERIEEGFPRGVMVHLLEGLSFLKPDESFRALNVSSRTWHRIKAEPSAARLDKDLSSRIWNLAEVLARAEEVLGDREAAEHWLAAPAIGLNSHRPIDLMATPQGAELVKTLLDRIAHGVYA